MTNDKLDMRGLKRCPFCNGWAKDYYGDDLRRIQCEQCGAAVQRRLREDVVRDWNATYPSCVNCRFKADWNNQYLCKRHAPVLSVEGVRYEGNMWPKVTHQTWCGDHERVKS